MMTGSDTIALSGGEWASLCALAARGAGYAWGLSEDAGAALACLSRWGVDATGAALDLFALNASAKLASPDSDGRHWSARGRALCPVRAGAFLSDLGMMAIDAEGLLLRDVVSPVLLMPFVLSVSRAAGRCVQVNWKEGAMVIGRDVAPQTLQAVCAIRQADLVLAPVDDSFGVDPAGFAPVPMDAGHNATLWGWAMKTMVPETDALRASGAGAGRIDND